MIRRAKKLSALTSLKVLLAVMAVVIGAGSGNTLGQAVLFFDDFEDGTADGWLPKNSSNWRVVVDEGDYSYQQSNTGITGHSQQLNEWSIYQNQTFGDMILSCKIKSPEDLSQNSLADYAIIFHYQNNDNYYFVFFNSSQNETKLWKRQNGIETELASYAPATVVDNRYHTVAVKTMNGNISVLALEKTIIQVQDVTFLSGKIGLGVRNDAAYFDNVFVSENVVSSCDFWDDFNDDILDGWTAHMLSRWSTKYYDGDYALWLNTSSYNSPGDKDLGEIITIDNAIVSDFTFECDLQSCEGSGNVNADLAFIFGYQDFSNYYYAILNRSASNTTLRRLQNGVAYDLDVYDPGVLFDQNWHHLKVTRSSGNISVYLDNQLILSGYDNVFSSGKVGVGSKNDSGYFDDICLTYQGQPPVTNIILTFNQIDPSAFPVIDCFVSVTDNAGNPITGLDASHFSVREDGVVQSPITVTPMPGSQLPVSVALVLDRSGSMQGQPLADAKAAANYFVDQMAANDKGAVISFESDVVVNQAFTIDKMVLHNAINSLVVGNMTSHYDAIVEAVNQCNTQSGRKAIVSLTDGNDNDSYYTIDNCIAAAKSAGVPVFTIGLGNQINESALIRIATETGGRYYHAPTSADLQQIYQLISLQLQNQYKITYTTSNPAYDCSARNVEIMATYQADSDTKTRTYQAPCTTAVPIYPTAPSAVVVAGTDFWLDIQVGTASKPVTNLFGVSFVLNYTNTQYLDVVTPYASSVVAGPFIGTDLVFFQDVNDAAGQISIGVARKSGAGGVNGFGSVARVHFMVLASTPDQTQLNFSLTSVSAIDPNGAPIQLDPQALVLTVSSGLLVWPGDANNNGYVDQADVLPLGVYFHKTGASRVGAPNNQWYGQLCSPPWNPLNATYADCDGTGQVNQADVFAIGLNWHRSHTTTFANFAAVPLKKATDAAVLRVVCKGDGTPNNRRHASLEIENVANLLGISYELVASNGEHILFDSTVYGEFMGDDLITFDEINNAQHVVSVGETRKADNGGVTGNGIVSKIYYHEKPDTPANTEIIFGLTNVVANDPDGQPIEVVVENANAVVPVVLVSFTAQASQRGVGLQWSTASESRCYGFAVERRFDTKVSSEWQELGLVNGSGTTAQQTNYTFFDSDLCSGSRRYRLKQIDIDGYATYSQELAVTVESVQEYELEQNYPNPFNPITSITLQLPQQEKVELLVFNQVGQVIRHLANTEMPAGSPQVVWDAKNDLGEPVASGIYLCQMTAGEHRGTIKMLLLK